MGEENIIEQTTKRTFETGNPYPSETIDTALSIVKEISDAKGSNSVSKRDEIAIILGISQGALNMKLSACVQYGILVNVFGKGYSPADLFDEFQRATEDEEVAIKIRLFGNPPLYKQIIQDYNGKPLPEDDKLIDLLKNRYKIHTNSTEKALRPFMENARTLKLIDNNRRLRYLVPKTLDGQSETGNSIGAEKEDPPPPYIPADDRNETSYPYNRSKVLPILVPFAKGDAAAFIPKDYDDAELDRLANIILAYKKSPTK